MKGDEEVKSMAKEEKIVLSKFKELLSKRLPTYRVMLFGSRARGDADECSDMDIIVITDGLNKETEDYISDCAWEAGIAEGIVVCPISYSTQEWESSLIQQSHFAKSVRRDGATI